MEILQKQKEVRCILQAQIIAANALSIEVFPTYRQKISVRFVQREEKSSSLEVQAIYLVLQGEIYNCFNEFCPVCF